MSDSYDEIFEGAEVEEVAEPQANEEIENEEVESDSDTGEEEAEVAEPQESDDEDTKPQKKQRTEDDAKFAAARREAEKQAREAQRQAYEFKERQDNFAKQYGYNTFEEMEQAQYTQQYVNQGYDEDVAKKLASVDNLQRDLEKRVAQARIVEEKARFKDQPYFKDFEEEIDSILEANPNLSVGIVFENVKGRNIDKILQMNSKAVKQAALNNINSKSHIKPDGKGVEDTTVVLDEAEWKFYKGLNPKASKDEYIKFLKNEKKKGR